MWRCHSEKYALWTAFKNGVYGTEYRIRVVDNAVATTVEHVENEVLSRLDFPDFELLWNEYQSRKLETVVMKPGESRRMFVDYAHEWTLSVADKAQCVCTRCGLQAPARNLPVGGLYEGQNNQCHPQLSSTSWLPSRIEVKKSVALLPKNWEAYAEQLADLYKKGFGNGPASYEFVADHIVRLDEPLDDQSDDRQHIRDGRKILQARLLKLLSELFGEAKCVSS